MVARALILTRKYDAAAGWYVGAAEGSDLHAFQILIDLAAPDAARDGAAQAAYAWFATNAAPQRNPDAQSALALGLSDVLRRLKRGCNIRSSRIGTPIQVGRLAAS